VKERRRIPLRAFVSYRRGDTAAYAGRLHDTLVERLDPANVFMDVDAIDLGSDFRTAIDGAISSADVVIVLIGRSWLTATDADGQRRLDDPDDVLRLELEAALAHDRVVIPVCVQGAEIPLAEDLPATLVPLATRQGIELRDGAWRDDVERLLRRLERVAEGSQAPKAPERRRRVGLRGALVLAGVTAAAVAAALVLTRDETPSAGNTGSGPGEQELLAAIPSPLRVNCTTNEDLPEAAVAGVSCAAGRAAVLYHRFESASVLRGWYELQLQGIAVTPDSGGCTAEEYGGERAYRVAGEAVGRHLCFVDDGAPELVWTDERALAAGEANVWERGTEPDAADAMLRLWDCCIQLEP
jgi:hypothetical protein